MRVLHVHSGNLYGGVETFLVTLARFRALCPEMEPEFALCFEGRLADELRQAGVPVHPLGAVRASRPWSVLRARAALRRLAGAGRYGVALVHSAWTQAMLAPAARRVGVPLAFYQHDPARGRHWVERLARRTPPGLVLCNSRYTAATLGLLFPGVRSEVLYCAAPPPPPPEPGARERLRAELGVPAGAAVILQASRMEAWKGHSLHLEALGKLKDLPGWVCWMAGGAQRPHEREYLASLERRAKALGISERVRLLGQRGDVPALLSAADIHCQPNTGAEPFGLAFIEALYAGLPVVATALGGPLEIVDERCGFKVAPEPAAVAEALRRLVTEPELRQRLGKAGPARARALCDPARQLPALAGLLESLARPT